MPKPVLDELLLQSLGMGQNQVELPAFGHLEGRSRPGAHMPDPDARLLFEPLLQRPDDAGVDRTDRAGQKNELVLLRLTGDIHRSARRKEKQQAQ